MPGFSLHKEWIPLCQLFWLSFWRHPFTAEDLVNKWCNYTFLQICSDDGTNVSTDGLRVNKCSANVPFGVNYSFEYFTELGDLILCLLQWDTYVFWYFHANLNVTAFPHLTDLLNSVLRLMRCCYDNHNACVLTCFNLPTAAQMKPSQEFISARLIRRLQLRLRKYIGFHNTEN